MASFRDLLKQAKSQIREVDPAGAEALIEGGALLLDVREPEEWQTGHAPGATLLAMGQVLGRRDELDPARRIVVVCRSGGRSAAVTQSLRAWGFDAVNLAGGMCAWSAAGLRVTPEPSPDLANAPPVE